MGHGARAISRRKTRIEMIITGALLGATHLTREWSSVGVVYIFGARPFSVASAIEGVVGEGPKNVMKHQCSYSITSTSTCTT